MTWECVKHMANAPCPHCEAERRGKAAELQRTIDDSIKSSGDKVSRGAISDLELVEMEKPPFEVIKRTPRQILRAVVEQYAENPKLTWVDMAVSKLILTLLDEAEWMNDVKKDDGLGTVEANFGMYIDGWTLSGTGVVGEVLCRNLDGREIQIPSKQFVAFIERRFAPAQTDGRE